MYKKRIHAFKYLCMQVKIMYTCQFQPKLTENALSMAPLDSKVSRWPAHFIYLLLKKLDMLSLKKGSFRSECALFSLCYVHVICKVH